MDGGVWKYTSGIIAFVWTFYIHYVTCFSSLHFTKEKTGRENFREEAVRKGRQENCFRAVYSSLKTDEN